MLLSSSVKNLLVTLAFSATFLPDTKVHAVKCGEWYSTDCLGDTDNRYDLDSTNDIVEQAPLWGEQAGYWRAVSSNFDSEGNPTQPMLFNPTNLEDGYGLPYKRDVTISYVNITFAGSRAYEHRLTINDPAPQEWCNANPAIPPAMNALNGGVCGVNGYASWTDSIKTSSYEKDGSIVNVGGALSFSQDTSFQPSGGIGTPIGGDTIFTSSYGSNTGGESTISKVWTFTNKAKTMADAQRSQYNTFGDVSILIGSTKLQYTKITEEEFIQGVQDEWAAKNVQVANRGEVPMQRACLASECATEEDWCVTDPDCSESPYQEPDADVRGEVIAGFVVAGAVLLVGALYVVHLRVIKKQSERIREALVKRIAADINVGFSDQALTVEGLQEEFNKIDTSNDGLVQKEELHAFIMSGKVGTISESDFNALFASLDDDGSGEIDFAEFISFIGKCGTQISTLSRKEKLDQISQQISVRNGNEVNVKEV